MKANRSSQPVDLVLVEWVDSLQPVTGWHMTDDLPVLEAARCKTVGWLVALNDDAMMIAQNIADPESTQMQAGGLMRIPKCCVTSASVLSSHLAPIRTQQECELASVSASRPRKELWKPAWILWVLFVSLAWCVGVGKKSLLVYRTSKVCHQHERKLTNGNRCQYQRKRRRSE